MENQDKFKEALDDLLLLAKGSGLSVTKGQIAEAFEGFDLTGEQEKLIYAYLDMNQIKVSDAEADEAALSYLKGSESKDKEEKNEETPAVTDKALTGEDSKVYKMYLEELETVEYLAEEELEKLLTEMKNGSQEARNRVTEAHLGRVVELAHEYAGRGVLLADLVQEGNMALLMAAMDYEDGDFGVYITREICSAMDAAIAEQTGQNDTGNYLAAQSNAMMKATEDLVNELGREATLAEVAQRMHLSEEMTRDIMKISMDALSAASANKTGETFGETNNLK